MGVDDLFGEGFCLQKGLLGLFTGFPKFSCRDRGGSLASPLSTRGYWVLELRLLGFGIERSCSVCVFRELSKAFCG